MSATRLYLPCLVTSTYTVKNGKIYNGKQNFKCRTVADSLYKIRNKGHWPSHQRPKLLLEKTLAGIARVGVSVSLWLQSYINAKYEFVRPARLTG